MKKLILVAVVSVALLFVGCKSENSNEVSRNTNKVETTAVTTTTNSKSGWQHLNEKSEKEFRSALGNPKVDKNAKINYVSANAKQKIKAVNLTKKQMSILIDHAKSYMMTSSYSGASKREYLERRVTQSLERYMEQRRCYIATETSNGDTFPVEGIDSPAGIIYPIIASGDVTGSVCMLDRKSVV